MAEETETPDPSELESVAGEEPKKKLNLSLTAIVLLVNSLVIFLALGAFVYVKILYKRPVISEESELAQKQEELKQPVTATTLPLVTFDQLRVNVAMTSGKAHYATVALATECRDEQAAMLVKARKDLMIDKVIAALGKRQMTELNTIQGKLLLKSDLMREFAKLIEPGAVTNIYFSTFILQ